MMTDHGLPTPRPAFEGDTEPYWRGAAAGRLVLPRCTECEAWVWYPRTLCPHDLSPVRWVTTSGRGVVYSHTTVHRGDGAYAKLPPFVIAYVELDEGPRVMTNVIGCSPDEVEIGMLVSVVFDLVEGVEGLAIPRFAPALPTADGGTLRPRSGRSTS